MSLAGRPMRVRDVAWVLALLALPVWGCGAGDTPGSAPSLANDASGSVPSDSSGDNDNGLTGSGGGDAAAGTVGSSLDGSTPVFFDASLGGFDGDLDALLGLLDERIDLSRATGTCARLRTCCGSVASTFDRVSCEAIVQEADQAQCQLGLTDDEEAGLCP